MPQKIKTPSVSYMTISRGISVDVIANGIDGRQTLGRLLVGVLSLSERISRASKKILVFWAAAILAILPPVLHFILVPLFFLLGLYLGVRSYLQTKLIFGGEVACPGCTQAVAINPQPEIWPLTVYCTHCRLGLKINRAVDRVIEP